MRRSFDVRRVHCGGGFGGGDYICEVSVFGVVLGVKFRATARGGYLWLSDGGEGG